MGREYARYGGPIASETGARQYTSFDGAIVNESTGGAADASATGATLTGAATIAGGAASGGGGGTATAPGAAVTGTATIAAGVATGGAGGTGTLTTRPQKNNAGTVMANETGAEVFIWDATTGALVLRKTNVTLSAAGIATVTDAAIIPGTSYSYDVKLTGNRRRCNPKAAT
jgi:hypothetical protein